MLPATIKISYAGSLKVKIMEQQTLDFKAPKPSKPVEVAKPEKDATPHIFSVGDLLSLARKQIELNFTGVWVMGEVSNLRTSPSGHTYFSLKDSKALLKAALFKGVAAKVPFQIKDGMELICHGNLSVYEKGSDLNLVVTSCEPKGVGALQLAFEQLKQKLAKEGLFDSSKKKPLPFLPRKIGVITSPTGAAIRDILNILNRRFPNIEVLLYPVRVQGEGSAPEIAAAIDWMNKNSGADVLIVGRGGGSLEDLWAFNEEVVARAIFASTLPIISAVGHEIDFTIADFVADKRAPTPSAAAEIVVPRKEDLSKFVGDKRLQLIRALKVSFEMKQKNFQQINAQLKPPTSRFPDLFMQIDNLRERLAHASASLIERKKANFIKLAAELSHLSPLAVLAKGYSVVLKGDKAVRSSKELKIGDLINCKFSVGEAIAKVQEKN